MEMKQDVTLATPALMGQSQPNEPYHAQLLQKQSSLGLLAPSQTSKAAAKVKTARQWLKNDQKYWTDEDTEELLKLNSEWNEDNIKAFLDCNIDTDLIMGYAEGSEIPQSLIEREVKLNKLFQDVMALAGVAPQLIKPEMINEVFGEMIQTAGLSIDFNNVENSEKLAEARYDRLAEMIKMSPINTDNPQINQGLAQQITALPQFQPFPTEQFDILIEFFTDKATSESAKDEPNYLLLTCLNALIELEQNAKVMDAQKMTAMQVAAQQPAINAAAAAQPQEAPQPDPLQLKGS